MAFDNRRTYLCYDNSDLIRDGFIKARIEKEYLPVDTFNIRRLRNPPKGVNYVVRRDSVTKEIISVREIKKQLPASKIKIEIDFSKVMRDSVVHPISPGAVALTPIGGLVGNLGLPFIGFGGISSGITYFTIHLLDAETKINRKITVTQEMLDTGIWVCEDGYPLSVFGIVSSYLIEATEPGEDDRVVNGLDFDSGPSEVPYAPRASDSDPEGQANSRNSNIIGKYSDGVWRGSRKKKISGATDSSGLFGGRGIPDVKFENVHYDGQPQLFNKIVRDDRTLKFRGDNFDASGGTDYPFRINGRPGIDVTDKQIRLNLKDEDGKSLFGLGDVLYITYSVASERHMRQNLRHRGDIGQGNTIGIVGFRGAIKSEVDAFDYRLMTWKVPKLPRGLEMENIDDLGDFYTEDDDYKLPLREYLHIRNLEETGGDTSNLHDTLEGWRLSEAITNGHVKRFWAADYRGIFLYDDFVKPPNIILPASRIRDKEWFRRYLESLDFTYPTGPLDIDGNATYIRNDLTKKIEDNIDLERESGFLFDLTDISNSLLFDREKIPYYRSFANALKDVSKFVGGFSASGVGIALLDLLEIADAAPAHMELNLYDLSYIEFYNVNAQPTKRHSCDEPFDITSFNYFSLSYDSNTLDGGMGAWYDQGHIENDVLGWLPSGSDIESYWKLETPYFCGDYTIKSRVYTERVSGPSSDNFSWIFVDTDPFVPDNISSDAHYNFDEAMVVFKDDLVHQGLCYNKFIGSAFEGHASLTEVDSSKSHIRGDYDHDADMIVGQNRMIGDYFSYSNGIPIVDDVVKVCKDGLGAEFWFSEEIYQGPTSYGLNFSDDIPKADIPRHWFIKKLTVDFSLFGYDDLTELEKYVSFYFEGSESSISEIKMVRGGGDIDESVSRIVIDFKYYYYGPLQFLGEFWKKMTVLNVEARYTTVEDARNTTSLDIDDYKIKSGQNAVVYDSLGRLLVFYADTSTGNINVALSYDDGSEWIIHKDLIRLIDGESAGLPLAIKDVTPDYVHLFYTINDSFLMYKRINTDLFIYEDAFVEAKVPISYDVDDYDQALISTADPPQQDWAEKVYWGEYSDKGNLLRRFPSYFVAGDASDPYFIEQLRIRDALNEDYTTSPSSDVRQYPRFEFAGNTSQMADSFRGEPYAVYMDDEGVLRLFMTDNGKLSVKRSNNYFAWKYDIREVVIHKDFIDDRLNKGIPEDIQNVQVVRNDYTAGRTSVLYFHFGMLFVRHFQSDLLFPFYDSNGEMNNTDMKEHLEITEDTTHLPIFLVGKIPESILTARFNEISSGQDNSELYIHFPYDRDTLEKFDERFEVDTNTQTYSYTTRQGLIRIFYKDNFGNLNGIILDALNKPTLEVMNKFKGT